MSGFMPLTPSLASLPEAGPSPDIFYTARRKPRHQLYLPAVPVALTSPSLLDSSGQLTGPFSCVTSYWLFA